MTCSSVNCCVCLSKGNESSEYNGRGRNKKNEKEKERIQGNCVCVYVVCRCWKWQQKGTPPEYSLFIAVREETDRPREGLLIYLFLHTISSGCVCVCPGCGGRKANHRDGRKRKGGGNCFGRRDGHSQIIYTASIWFHRQPSFSLSIDFTPVGPAFRMIYANLCCCPLQIPGLQITEMRCSITSPSAGSDTELIVMKALVLLRPY